MSLIKQLALSIDQFFNIFFYHKGEGFGMADETLSARCWRLREASAFWKYFRIVVDTLFFLQKKHCYQSYLSEVYRKQLPSEYRDYIEK